MKKIGLTFIVVEIVILLIIGYHTAQVPSRPQIDAIHLQQFPSSLFSREKSIASASESALPPNASSILQNKNIQRYTNFHEIHVANALDSQ